MTHNCVLELLMDQLFVTKGLHVAKKENDKFAKSVSVSWPSNVDDFTQTKTAKDQQQPPPKKTSTSRRWQKLRQNNPTLFWWSDFRLYNQSIANETPWASVPPPSSLLLEASKKSGGQSPTNGSSTKAPFPDPWKWKLRSRDHFLAGNTYDFGEVGMLHTLAPGFSDL